MPALRQIACLFGVTLVKHEMGDVLSRHWKLLYMAECRYSTMKITVHCYQLLPLFSHFHLVFVHPSKTFV